MKILESKYYQPRKIFNERYVGNQYQIIAEKLDKKISTTDNPYYSALTNSLPSLDFENIVIKKEHLVDFIKCTDFYPVRYDRKKQIFYENEACYFYDKFGLFLVVSEI